VDANFSLTDLTYDGLDRLKTVTGGDSIGSSSLTYDTFGNIKTYNSKDNKLVYKYDTSSRLETATKDNSEKKRDSGDEEEDTDEENADEIMIVEKLR